MNNITSSNASISMTSALGNIDFSKFSSDSIGSSEMVKFTETHIGVDGQISAGFVPTIKTFTINFEASSSSIPYLLDLARLAEATKTPQPVVMTITIPSVNKKFIGTGFFTDCPPVYNLGKVLEPMSFKFDLEIIPMPL